MRITRTWPLFAALWWLPTHAQTEAEQPVPTATVTDPNQPQELEPIPDDIWSTIASPFDPINTPPGYAPPAPRQHIERAAPARQQIIQQPPVAQQPRMMTQPAPVQQRPVQRQVNRYPAQPVPQPVPYELPPQERAVADYPEEYWNCLLNNLQGVGSDVAAKLITRACQKKHPKQ